ncbi:MAG: calcium-binding protein [Cytophagales bacterium]
MFYTPVGYFAKGSYKIENINFSDGS